MVNVLVAYATPDLDDGVLPRLLTWIQDRGFDPLPVRIGKDKLLDWIPFDQAVVAVSLAEGAHQEAFARFVRENRSTLEAKPALFLSFEDPALPADEQGPEREAYVLEELELATGWRPNQAWLLDPPQARGPAATCVEAHPAPSEIRVIDRMDPITKGSKVLKGHEAQGDRVGGPRGIRRA